MSARAVTCGCGFASATTECKLAFSELRDAHYRRCDFSPSLPLPCGVCGEIDMARCPAWSHLGGFIRTDAVLIAGCWSGLLI